MMIPLKKLSKTGKRIPLRSMIPFITEFKQTRELEEKQLRTELIEAWKKYCHEMDVKDRIFVLMLIVSLIIFLSVILNT